MKSPYDTALRIAERRLDAVRVEIGRAAGEVERLNRSHLAVEHALARETALLAPDQRMVTETYFANARARRLRLTVEHKRAEWRLEDLRREAVECFGSRNALETAATRHNESVTRAAVSHEQAALDDFTGARHTAAVRGRRPTPAGLATGSPP